MCEYCGCRGVPAIADLMAEHAALVDQAGHILVTLGAAGWAVIDEAHARTPSFLLDPDAASPDPAPV